MKFKLVRINKIGMTIIEIIVSIAIIGIISVLLLTVFGSSTLLAVNSGDNTYVAEIANGVTVEKIATKVGNPTTAHINFNINGNIVNENFVVNGKYVEGTANSAKANNETVIKTFVTD